ncbi:MAG: hypothetical protein HUK24_04605, partial [Sphaerochaetaceae bacterium]|nr:hypothetical protein [Sphaerochaetaceae bacterium]
MKKVFIVFILVMILIPTVFGKDSVLFKDVALRLGDGKIYDCMGNGIQLLEGVVIGLTPHTEIAFESMVPLVPKPFENFTAGFELGISLFERSNNKGLSGPGINSMFCLGLFGTNANDEGTFLPTYITFKVNSISFGNPYCEKRETFLPLGVAYNLREKSWTFFTSFVLYDFYIKGTWKDE